MEEIHSSQDAEPPLSRNAKPGELADILLFFQTISKRCGMYMLWFAKVLVSVVAWLMSVVHKMKKAVLRLLMFRGGYFYHTHRLGLATITSTTVFSLFLVPFVGPLQEINSVSGILAEGNYETAASEEFVFSNAVRVGNFETNTHDEMRNEVVEYTVEEGDTISTISEQFLVSAEALKYANSMGSSDLIHPGETLVVPPVGGLIHSVDEDETISSIATLYSVSPQALVDFNHLEEPFIIHSGDELVVPDAKIPAIKSETPSYLAQSSLGQVAGLTLETIAPPQTGNGGFVMPASGVITQYFWWGHTAIDIANGSCGSPIVAADSGTITFAGWWPGGGGNSVFIDHGNGFVTKYAHLSGFAKTSGGVQRGDVIGYMGDTGRAYGCHVHFIVNQNGYPINPLSVL